ncbi:MAG: prolipoprotein diacylglyceryl transferase [Actinomycetes bacterium]|jgi:phosphatidylglycerol:prolipoprotein diacylglycerol transferase|nr:prolipoprotein diacylglyceryl transferase [Actinomycetes bacterium]
MREFLENFQHIDPIALRIGPVAVHWYGVGYLIAFLAAFLLMRHYVRRWQLDMSVDDATTILLGAILGTFLGGRLGYCLFYDPVYFLTHPVAIVDFWHGGISGMSFHGGFIGIFLGGWIAARIVKFPVLRLADLGSIGAPVGFGLVRIANFINGELWGRPSTLPWAIVFPDAPLVAGVNVTRHPSQLYEALLEGAVLLVLMLILAHRTPPRPQGQLFGWLTLFYGVFRIAVEFVREPDAHIGFLGAAGGTGWLTMGMVLSLPMVVGGIILICWTAKRGQKEIRA